MISQDLMGHFKVRHQVTVREPNAYVTTCADAFDIQNDNKDMRK